MSKLVLTDQTGSAKRALTKALVRHGDTTRLAMVAGMIPHPGGTTLFFCPSTFRVLKIRKRGKRVENKKPINGNVFLQDVGERIYNRLKDQSGWLASVVDVTSNGNVHIKPFAETIRIYPIQTRGSHVLQHIDGLPEAENVLDRYINECRTACPTLITAV